MTRLTINGRTVQASPGDNVIEAALAGRIVIPQDCGSGQCGTCRVTVFEGALDDAGTRQGRTVLACRSRITGDVAIAFDPVPNVQTVAGEVTEIIDLSPSTCQVRIATRRRLTWLAGQYVRVTFKGSPARDLSPTFPLDLAIGENDLVFHMTRHEGGAVSSRLGREIGPGHVVSITGPFGSAFLRQGEGPIVLASTGTGFAPVWAVAIAARLGQHWRPVTLIAGARHARDLYMAPAATLFSEKGGRLLLTASDGDGVAVDTRRPQDMLPDFGADATVFAAGAPAMVEAVGRQALARGATFHADIFTPAAAERPSLMGKLRGFIGRR